MLKFHHCDNFFKVLLVRMKTTPKNLNVMKQHEVLKSQMASISTSLSEISKHIEKWPIQPTEPRDSKEGENDSTNFEDISHIFAIFSNLLGPLEAGEAYKKLVDIRKKVHESKRKFENLKANKDTVGPEAVLQEATNLRPLLGALRKAESDFVYVLMHQWRAAIQAIDSDLLEIQSKGLTD